ncbi:MAG: hypothetical protein LBU61_03170 [Coriobacteriales bacterium]|jgi:hypothetical protein|nr:hypothetical protein [Coriobacteriales bacterium]
MITDSKLSYPFPVVLTTECLTRLVSVIEKFSDSSNKSVSLVTLFSSGEQATANSVHEFVACKQNTESTITRLELCNHDGSVSVRFGKPIAEGITILTDTTTEITFQLADHNRAQEFRTQTLRILDEQRSALAGRSQAVPTALFLANLLMVPLLVFTGIFTGYSLPGTVFSGNVFAIYAPWIAVLLILFALASITWGSIFNSVFYAWNSRFEKIVKQTALYQKAFYSLFITAFVISVSLVGLAFV